MAENLLPPPPAGAAVVDSNGFMTRPLVAFLNAIRRAVGEPEGPPPLKAYAKANVPAASSNLGKTIWVTDAAAGAWAYISDGTNWLDLSTKAVLS